MKVYVITYEDVCPNCKVLSGVYGVYDTRKKAQEELKRIYQDEIDESKQENYTLGANCLEYEYNDFDKVTYEIVEKEVE